MEMSISNSQPHGTAFYPLQIAGHKTEGKLGLLKHKNGNILKPLREDDKRAASELTFYKTIFADLPCDPTVLQLRHFIPVFRGIWTTIVSAKEVQYLCLEDLCEKFQSPSVLDVKMGAITHDPDADEEKILYEKSKNPFGEVLGFRILGMKVYKEHEKSYFSLDKEFGKRLTPDTVTSALELFFTDDKLTNCLILSGFIHDLHHIEKWFSHQRSFAIYASSILFIYERVSSWTKWIHANILEFQGLVEENKEAEQIDIQCNSFLKSFFSNPSIADICDICGLHIKVCDKIVKNCSLFRVAMIDFAHVFPSNKEDRNYVFGLRKVMEYFCSMLRYNIKKLTM